MASYLKYGINDMVLELINQIKSEELIVLRLRNISAEDFKRF